VSLSLLGRDQKGSMPINCPRGCDSTVQEKKKEGAIGKGNSGGRTIGPAIACRGLLGGKSDIRRKTGEGFARNILSCWREKR